MAHATINDLQLKPWPQLITDIYEQISADPTAIKMSYCDRIEQKINVLLEHIPKLDDSLAAFCAELLCNVSIKATHIEGALRFLSKIHPDDFNKVTALFALLWPHRDESVLKAGLSEDKSARISTMNATLNKIKSIQSFVKSTPSHAWDAASIKKVSRVLDIDITNSMELIQIRPRILRGLKKAPRPLYAWPLPLLLSTFLFQGTITYFGNHHLAYAIMLSSFSISLWFICTRLPIAPGILYYQKTKQRIKQVLKQTVPLSQEQRDMQELGINAQAFAHPRTYRQKESGATLYIRNKHDVTGILEFLTSSEEIGNCIALRNFVSWSLPSLLNDDSIMLCDVYLKKKQRAQLWMVAAEQDGEAVLTVNSIEFNNEGVKYIEQLMPEIVHVLQDHAQRCGFKRIYLGISEYGRKWFDAHYPQSNRQSAIYKIHNKALGYRYYFDAFSKYGIFNKRYRYQQQRSLVSRLYALTFGIIEYIKGNHHKAHAFFDSISNKHNCWEIPLSTDA